MKESSKHRSSATQALRIGATAAIVFLTACTPGRLPHALHESRKTPEHSVPDILDRLSPDSVGRNEDGNVVAVTLSMKPVEDSVIAQIATLPDVVMLRLDFTDITDALAVALAARVIAKESTKKLIARTAGPAILLLSAQGVLAEAAAASRRLHKVLPDVHQELRARNLDMLYFLVEPELRSIVALTGEIQKARD